MRKTTIVAALAASCGLFSLPALAADNGIYLGASVGQSSVQYDDLDLDFDASAPASRSSRAGASSTGSRSKATTSTSARATTTCSARKWSRT